MNRFGKATDELLRLAIIDQTWGRKLTKEQRLLLLMGDGNWHSSRELALKVSHRFGGYLHTLRDKGAYWEKKRDANAPKGEAWWLYRLYDPDEQTGSLF